MRNLLYAGRFFLLIISMMGYVGLLMRRLHIHAAFAPAIFCAGVSSVLFAAGILNLLPLTAFLVFVAGLVLFALDAKNAAVRGNNRPQPAGCIVLYAVLLLFFFLHLKDAHYTHYDNFSHWALVVREILLTDRMPCYKDTLLFFKSYPLGSALTIYYVCKIIGNSEACYLFAQAMMSISFLLPLAAFVKKKWQSVILVFLFGIYALISNISIYDLLVDTVMPLAAVAAVCLILYEEKASRETILALAPLMIFLIQVKSSGLFFAASCWGIWIIKNLSAVRGDRRLFLHFALYDVGLPLASFLIWHKHVRLVFDPLEDALHVVSFSYYSTQLSQKTASIIRDIWKALVACVFSVDGRTFALMALICVMLAILFFSSKDSRRRKALLILLGEILFLFASYIVGLFAMYIFSMPVAQLDFRTGLPGFDRYMCSGLLFLYGLSIIYALKYLPELNRFAAALLVALCLLPVYRCRSALNTLVTRQDYQSTDRFRFVTLLEDNNVKGERCYALYQTNNDSYYYYLSAYELRSLCCDWFSCEKNYEELKEKYNYLIILEQDEQIQNWLTANGLTEYISDEAAVIELAPSQP